MEKIVFIQNTFSVGGNSRQCCKLLKFMYLGRPSGTFKSHSQQLYTLSMDRTGWDNFISVSSTFVLTLALVCSMTSGRFVKLICVSVPLSVKWNSIIFTSLGLFWGLIKIVYVKLKTGLANGMARLAILLSL